MTTAILKYLWAYNKEQSKTRILKFPFLSLNWNISYIIGFIIITFSLFFYVYSINELTRGAYLIKKYEKAADSLLQKNKTLEVGFAKSGFVGNLEAKTKELGFEKIQKIKYIQIQKTDDSLATAK